ncbi:MAG: periplasmic heavy metal sensor [Nibricoccus sp.]
MKKLIPASLIVLVACTALGATALRAQPQHPRTHQAARFKPGALRKQLDLTDAQVAQIKTAFASEKDAMKAQAHKVRDARVQLREAIQAGAPDTQIRAAAANVGSAEGDFAVQRAALFAKIKPILTPEQLAKLHELKNSRL